MGGINLMYTFYYPGILYSFKISTFGAWRAMRTLSALNQLQLPIHTLIIHYRNSIQGLGRRMKPIFKMGLFLSFFGGKSLSSHFYISHQWKFRTTEIVQSVGMDFSPGDWFYFIITEENRNLLSLKKVEELELSCQGRHIPKLLQLLLRSFFTDFPV